eukprot:RCo039337
MGGDSLPAVLHPAVPRDWLWLPRPLRLVLGWAYLVLFSLSFFGAVPVLLLVFPWVWRRFPYLAGGYLLCLAVSLTLPPREWKPFRKLGQLWYELFSFSTNISPEEALARVGYAEHHQMILAMHPHGIVPFHSLLWAAYGDQYLSDGSRECYGFGAVADIVTHAPFLRNVMGLLGGGSAKYSVLRRGLVEGKVDSVPGRAPRHLYILPGGIAEIFTSAPGRHKIVFKDRRGLCRLSVETGAQLVPCYVFGATDFYHNLATEEGTVPRLLRRCRVGVTVFFGRWGTFIPFTPRVTMILGEPIPVPVVEPGEEGVSKAIDTLHARFLEGMQEIFEKYKAAAGYPGATLEIA